MKSKNLLIIIGFLLLIIAGWFYWFQLKPSKIRSRCKSEAEIRALGTVKTLIDKPGYDERGMSQQRLEDMYDAGLYFESDYDSYYRKCLNEHGLK